MVIRSWENVIVLKLSQNSGTARSRKFMLCSYVMKIESNRDHPKNIHKEYKISSSFWYMIETWPNLAHRKKIGVWGYQNWIPVGMRAYVLLLHKCVSLSEPHWVTPWTHKFFHGLILIMLQTYIKMKKLFIFLVYVFGVISIRLNFYYITT